jgi:hypothetical protein
MKTKVSYEKCSIYVEGMSIVCPLCQTHVQSGESHKCSRPDKRTIEGAKKRKVKGKIDIQET